MWLGSADDMFHLQAEHNEQQGLASIIVAEAIVQSFTWTEDDICSSVGQSRQWAEPGSGFVLKPNFIISTSLGTNRPDSQPANGHQIPRDSLRLRPGGRPASSQLSGRTNPAR